MGGRLAVACLGAMVIHILLCVCRLAPACLFSSFFPDASSRRCTGFGKCRSAVMLMPRGARKLGVMGGSAPKIRGLKVCRKFWDNWSYFSLREKKILPVSLGN